MKKMIVFALAICALLVGSVPASAQIFRGQYGPADRLINENINMVDRWMSYGGYYGYRMGDQFYAVYDRQGRPLSRPMKVAIGSAAGAVIGAALDRCNRLRGGLIGAGIGAGATILIDKIMNRGRNQQVSYEGPEAVEVDPSQLPPPPPGGPAGYGQPQRRPQYGQRPTSVGPMAGPGVGAVGGQFRLVNATNFAVEVYDGQEYLGRLQPRSEMRVDAPNAGYQGYALIPNNRGSLSSDVTDIHASDNGWVFVAPAYR